MFNGIIKNTGTINKIYKKNRNCVIEILSTMKFSKKDIGSSISCSGACLTVEKYNKNLVKFFLSKENIPNILSALPLRLINFISGNSLQIVS